MDAVGCFEGDEEEEEDEEEMDVDEEICKQVLGGRGGSGGRLEARLSPGGLCPTSQGPRGTVLAFIDTYACHNLVPIGAIF